MRCIYLIVASDDPIHVQDETTQRETWAGKNLDQVIWLRGGENTHFDDSKRTLYVGVPEKYENILAKSILGIKWCIINLDFDFLVRANVSTYFVPKKVNAYLAEDKKDRDFFGGYLDFRKSTAGAKSETLFVNGGALFLSRVTAFKLARMDVSEWQRSPDDFAMSQFLIQKGIKPTWIPRGNVASTGILNNKMYYRMKSSGNSNMASIRMHFLDKILVTPNVLKKVQLYFFFVLSEIKNFRMNHINLYQYVLSLHSVVNSRIKSRKLLRALHE